MRSRTAVLFLALALVAGGDALAKAPRHKRSAAAKTTFRSANPCPVTGKSRGPCPGWVIDHVIPLCAGGADAPSNMQWQTVAAGKAKDVIERRECAALRKR
jgi:hypothetical protein